MQVYQRQPKKPPARAHSRPSPSRPAIARDPDFSDAFAGLEKEAIEVGNELLSVALACPKRESCASGIAIAQRCGIIADTFAGDDQKIIFRAMLATAPEHRLDVVLPLARHWLRDAGFFDDADTRAFMRTAIWSDASLVSLADGWPGSSFTFVYAKRLLEIRGRQKKIVEHYEYLSSLLREVA
jgi:hypothetical protein